MKDYEEKVINIMDSAKDNIRIQLDKAYKSGYEDAKSELGQNAIDLAHEESDRAYQQGLEDAWEVARKIIEFAVHSTDVLRKIFGEVLLQLIFKHNTASEAIAKIKEYEEQQKQDAIQVGDEVYRLDENHPRVVTSIFDDCGCMFAVQISYNGKWTVDDIEDIHKTGRHFPQIAEVLAEMRGDKE